MPCHAQIRTFAPCPGDGNCNWVETGTPLQNGRWYATNQRMPDGSQAIFGGRSCDTVEYVPSKGAPVYIPLIANVNPNSLSLSSSSTLEILCADPHAFSRDPLFRYPSVD